MFDTFKLTLRRIEIEKQREKSIAVNSVTSLPLKSWECRLNVSFKRRHLEMSTAQLCTRNAVPHCDCICNGNHQGQGVLSKNKNQNNSQLKKHSSQNIVKKKQTNTVTIKRHVNNISRAAAEWRAFGEPACSTAFVAVSELFRVGEQHHHHPTMVIVHGKRE